MTALELPAGVVANDMEMDFIDAGAWQSGALGGADIRVDRPGSRYAVRLSFPPVESRKLGRLTVSRLIRAQRLGLRVALPLGDFDPGIPGSPVVDGDGQAGTSLAVRGFTPGYRIVEGQWFTHLSGEDALLYNIAAPAVADASGKAVIVVEPELGLEPEDGDRLLFRRPVIQGRPAGEERRWRMALERRIGFEVAIREMI